MVEELQRTRDEQRRRELLALVEGLPRLSSASEEILTLAEEYVAAGAVPTLADALHLAIATVHGLDVVVSWNYRDIVNVRTKRAINALNVLLGYRELELATPAML